MLGCSKLNTFGVGGGEAVHLEYSQRTTVVERCSDFTEWKMKQGEAKHYKDSKVMLNLLIDPV